MKSLYRLALVSSTVLAMSVNALAQETVVWWDFLGGGDGVRMKALIEEFNTEHAGDIQIDGTTLEWGSPFYSKLQTSAAVGQGPDVATYHLSRIPLAVSSGTLAEITDADLQTAGLADSDYSAAAISASKVDGARYAIPFDVHAYILYYNRELLSEAGMLGEDGLPTSLDGLENFEAALAKFTHDDMYGISFPTPDRFRLVYSYFGQMGGTMYDPKDGFFPGDNVDKLTTATATIAKWSEKGWTPTQIEYAASLAMFVSKKTPFHINGNWEVPTFADLKSKGELFEWGAIQLPVLFDQPASWSDSHAFVIPQNAGVEQTAEKRAAVLKVIGWMNEHSLAWADAGHLPAYNAVREGEGFAALKPQSDYASLAATAIFDPRTILAGPAAPLGDAWTNYIVPGTTGELTPEEAATEMRDDLNDQL